MNKKIMYSIIPAIAAFGALVGFKGNSKTVNNNTVITNNNNKTKNVSNRKSRNDDWIEIKQDDTTPAQVILEAGKTYYLGSNIDLSKLTSGGRTFILNSGTGTSETNFYLEGYTIKGCAQNNIFSIGADYTLNLYDYNVEPAQKSKHYFTEKDSTDPSNNYWIPSDTETSLSLDGGILYCENCIAIGTMGTFNMYGGSIVGYSQNDRTLTYGWQDSIVSMTNGYNAVINIEAGNIVGCNAKQELIHVGRFDTGTPTLNIKGGEIRNSYGLSCILRNYHTANITGGKIHDCYSNSDCVISTIYMSGSPFIPTTTIAGDAEITDNVTLRTSELSCCVSTYKSELCLGGKAKVINNKRLTDKDTSKPISERLKTAVLSNIMYYYQSDSTTIPTLTPLTTGEYALESGAEFGFTGKMYDTVERKVSDIEYQFTKPLDKSCVEYFTSDNSKYVICELPDKSLKTSELKDPIKPGEAVKKVTSKMPEGKPTVENVIVTKGAIDSSVEVVVNDKEDLGEIKEKVDENIKKQLSSNTNLISQFDIHLEQNGVEVKFDGNEYLVTLKLPENYSGLSEQNVIYIKTDGSIETKTTKVTGNKCTFTTSHFSTWGFAAEGKLTPDPTPTPPGGGGLSTATIAGITAGSVAGGGTIFFIIFIVFFTKKVKFVTNEKVVYIEELKWKENINFKDKIIAGKKWYTDKQLTKPFNRTKMGLFSKTLYSTKTDKFININVIYGHSLEEYCKKYKNCKCMLLKFSKKEIEGFDKKYSIKNNFLLTGCTWWYINGTYYEIPKPFTCAWFSNLFNRK